MTRRSPRWHLLFVVMLVLTLLPPLQIAPAARAAGETDLITAVQTAVASDRGAEADTIIVQVVEERDGWAYGTAATDAATVYTFLAHEDEAGWTVALRYTAEFSALLAQTPADFPSRDIRATLDGFTAAGEGSADLSFPYGFGQAMRFYDAYWTDHLTFYPYLDTTVTNVPIYAMRGGIAYKPCDGLVMIDHGDGWATYYAYVGGSSITNGQAVTRGQQLGVTSASAGCAGAGDGRQMSVWVTKYGELQSLNGFDIGGYTIQTPPGGTHLIAGEYVTSCERPARTDGSSGRP